MIMSDHNKLNIFIIKNNKRTDETPSNFNVIIPDGLLKVNSEDFELNVISFFVTIIFIIVIITLINFK